MKTRRPAPERRASAIVAFVSCLLTASPVGAAGFLVFEQGARAMGLANAFVAQADDPSAIFFNPGGLAFFEDRAFQSGLTMLSLGDSTFRGLPPAPGRSAAGSQQSRFAARPQFYWVEPLGRRVVFGLAINSPFGWSTDWEDADAWAGRFIAEQAELSSFDFNPVVAWQATPRVGVALGLVVRASELELRRREQLENPATMLPEEVARTEMTSDVETAAGFSVGLLHRPSGRITWGLSYRSGMAIDYSGSARLTPVPSGDPAFDAFVDGQLPFEGRVPFRTSIEFPDMASVALAWQINPSVLVEVDVNRVGWNGFEAVELEFPTAPPLSGRRLMSWDDTRSYRAGWRWSGQGNGEWRAGVWLDETPQPAETLGPLLPDADRLGFSVGYGTKVLGVQTDLALMYVDFDSRESRDNVDGFDGSYENEIALLGASLSW